MEARGGDGRGRRPRGTILAPALSSVLPQVDFVVPIFDATELHALAAVDWALGAKSEAAS
jgi:hypothetical protein